MIVFFIQIFLPFSCFFPTWNMSYSHHLAICLRINFRFLDIKILFWIAFITRIDSILPQWTNHSIIIIILLNKWRSFCDLDGFFRVDNMIIRDIWVEIEFLWRIMLRWYMVRIFPIIRVLHIGMIIVYPWRILELFPIIRRRLWVIARMITRRITTRRITRRIIIRRITRRIIARRITRGIIARRIRYRNNNIHYWLSITLFLELFFVCIYFIVAFFKNINFFFLVNDLIIQPCIIFMFSIDHH